MNEWRKVKLKEFIMYASRGITPKYSETSEGIIVLNQKCIRNQKLNLSESRLHADYLKKVSLEKIIQKYDILINSTGVGTLGRICQNNLNVKMTVDSHITIIRPDINKIDPIFLGYSLKNQQSFIESLGEGSTGQTELKKDRLINEIEIKVPLNIGLQKKISKILSDIDNKIELNNKINDNLEKQALLFFKKLLSNEQNNYCKLSDIALINPKYMLNKNIIARYIDMAELSTSNSFPNGWKLKKYNGGMRFKNNDTLLARITPCLENGKSAFINFLDENEIAFGSTEYIVISSKGEYPPEFFYCLTKYPIFLDFAIKNMNGSSGRQRVSGETIGNFILPKLDNKDLKVFSKLASSIFNTIKCKNFENIYLTNLKKYLLPKLMNGEIDVEKIEL